LIGRSCQPGCQLTPQSPLRGLWFSVGIIGAWAASLAVLLPLDRASLPPALIILAVLARTFLQTGLFIVAHDAMHGSLLPSSQRWNDRLGRLALSLYACLPWESCRHNHQRHHLAPASQSDPDHHDGHHRSAAAWYVRFMAKYLSPAQMAGLLGLWLISALLLNGLTPQPLANLLLFWILPLLLSSIQLFLFGTYLPHREGAATAVDRHHSRSLPLTPALSLLACYHFGYHWEHHEDPQLPWFQLPERRRQFITDHIADPTGLALPKTSR
jgi:beta-carotene ketolase (CrtW type)